MMSPRSLCCAIGALFAASASLAQAQADLPYPTRVHALLGSFQPTSAAPLGFADLDGDGRADPLLLLDGGFQWRRSLPDFELGPAQTFSYSGVTRLLAVLDADADGDLDVYGGVSAFAWNPDVALYENLGAGQFATPVAIDVAAAPKGIVRVADLDGNGWPDLVSLVAAPAGQAKVAILRATGPFAFAAPTFATSAKPALQVHVGDFDGSGSADLLLQPASGAANVCLGAGDGTFATGVAVNASFSAGDFATALDVDLDGRADLVVDAQTGAGTALHTLLLGGHPQGFFAPLALPCALGGRLAASIDRDADGVPDLAFASGENVQFVRVEPGVGFSAWPVLGVPALELALSDLDGDGARELLSMPAPSFGVPGALSIVRGSSGGGLIPYEPVLPGTFGGVEVADLDGDGGADVVIVASEPQGSAAQLLVRPSAGDGFGPALPPQSHTSGEFRLADANGDGRADLVSCEYIGPRHATRLGHGDGTFGAPIVTAIAHAELATSVYKYNLPDIEVADYDGDGHVDLLTAKTNAVLAFGAGDGTFPVQQSVHGTAYMYKCRPGPRVDLNEDGFVDLLLVQMAYVSSGSGPPLHAWLSDGHGGFHASNTIESKSGPRPIAGDFNGDGHADIAQSGVLDVLEIHLGDGSGALPAAYVAPPGAWGLAMHAADVDADGYDDVVCMRGTLLPARSLQVCQGGADFSAANAQPYFALGSGDVAALDVDRDGRLELVTDAGCLLRLPPPRFAGIAAYGSGTSGCVGAHTLVGSRAPSVGASDFRLVCQGAPPQVHGIGLFAPSADAGADPFGIGLTLHVGAPFVAFPIASSASGSASKLAPIPSDPLLVGATLHAQLVWPWSASASCDPSPLGWSSSRGLALRIQP